MSYGICCLLRCAEYDIKLKSVFLMNTHILKLSCWKPFFNFLLLLFHRHWLCRPSKWWWILWMLYCLLVGGKIFGIHLIHAFGHKLCQILRVIQRFSKTAVANLRVNVVNMPEDGNCSFCGNVGQLSTLNVHCTQNQSFTLNSSHKNLRTSIWFISKIYYMNMHCSSIGI